MVVPNEEPKKPRNPKKPSKLKEPTRPNKPRAKSLPVSVPASSTWLVPDGCSLEHAAYVPVSWGTAQDCLFEFGRLQADETVRSSQCPGPGTRIICVRLLSP